MKRLLIGSVALAFAALAGCATPPAPSVTEIKRSRLSDLGETERAMVETVRKCFVRLDGPRGTGSAMAISPDGKILTAWHVVEGTFLSYSKNGAPPEQRSLCSGRTQDRAFSGVTLVAACPDQDIAILDIGIPTPAHVSPTLRGFALGERVFLIGGAADGKPEVTECTKARATLDRGSLLFMMNAPALPGDSGGGVINQRGELLGVLVRGKNIPLDEAEQRALPGWQWISMMVPVPTPVMEQLLRTRTLQTGTRLFFDPEPAEGRINPEAVWKTIRLSSNAASER